MGGFVQSKIKSFGLHNSPGVEWEGRTEWKDEGRYRCSEAEADYNRSRHAQELEVLTKEIRAHFIEPMLLLATSDLPQGDAWAYELKLDGYRAIAYKTNGRIQLRSRNDKDFSRRYPTIAAALSKLPDETVIDGEIVTLNESGRPSFNALPNYGKSNVPIFYYLFDVLVLSGKDLRSEPLEKRRDLLRRQLLPKTEGPDTPVPRTERRPL